MAIWWSSLSVVMKVLWGVTLSASFIFIVQSIMTFLGAGTDGMDSPDSLDGAGMPDSPDGVPSGANLYTFRNLVNFLLGFGWTAILLQKSISSTGLLLVISVLVGVALVAIVMFLFKWLSSMQQSGNINLYRNAAGCQGSVYLTIPPQRRGEGKVQITINNSVREYNAVTDMDEAIPTGTGITVMEVIDSQTLLVESKNSLII